jgi:hypothetical protein
MVALRLDNASFEIGGMIGAALGMHPSSLTPLSLS